MGSSSSAHSEEVQAMQAQQRAEAVRRKAMELNASRQQMQNLRNTQLQRSMALNSATNQGAQFGTGLQGGYGQISGESGDNRLGISQNLEFGEQMFDANAEASAHKLRASNYQSQASTWQGIGAIGSSLMKAAPTIGNLGSGIFGGGGKGTVDLYGPDFTRIGSYSGR